MSVAIKMSKNDRLARAMAAQMKDVDEMERIIHTARTSGDPNAACSKIVGGDFKLSDLVKRGIVE